MHDSSFDAMALDAAGHYAEAQQYWEMDGPPNQLSNGTWGEPRTTVMDRCLHYFLLSSRNIDSVGEFLVGAYRDYQLSGNTDVPRRCLARRPGGGELHRQQRRQQRPRPGGLQHLGADYISTTPSPRPSTSQDSERRPTSLSMRPTRDGRGTAGTAPPDLDPLGRAALLQLEPAR